MREIKFRGKRKDNGEWVYGGYYQGVMQETNNPLSIDNARIKTIIIQDGTYYHVIPESVGQYIVTEDKAKIFEHDVVEEWKHNIFIRRFVANDIRTLTREYDTSGHNSIWKIIGNTTDNPELLEEK